MTTKKKARASGHIITPEGREICSTKKVWNGMPDDWKSLAAYFPCSGCPQRVGDEANHPAAGG